MVMTLNDLLCNYLTQQRKNQILSSGGCILDINKYFKSIIAGLVHTIVSVFMLK